MTAPPLVAHVIHRLGMGGLENGLVNLLNHLPHHAYRHAVVCLTDATRFRERIRRADVEVVELHKREGKDLAVLARLWRAFRRLRPAIVHSRNLAALESQIPALLAGVPVRVHGEHGRDVYDPDGENRKYLLLRRAMRPAITRWVPMSQDLASWLHTRVGVPDARISQLYSGVDPERFRPDPQARDEWPVAEWRDRGLFLIGAVGRMEAIKDPLNLLRAFVGLVRALPPESARRVRLAYLGDGPLRPRAQELVEEAGLVDRVFLPGARDDVPRLMAAFDLFVLPSLGEGISNTVLEAMSCGVPVVATRVGGNPELVADDTGRLVPPADPAALAAAIRAYVDDPELCRVHGAAARRQIETRFALPVMVERYHSLYQQLLAAR